MNINLDYLDFQIPVFFDWPEGVRYKVITKGRRTGITKGAANNFIEDLLDGQGPLLWGDTINANIDKYFTRYFLPELKNNGIAHQWEAQKKQLTIKRQYCDFRSADNPENWEGFGYKKVFLNEAGIILKDKDLYAQTVLPMLLDFPDSKLIAAGVPKGKYLRDGTEHPFYTLAKKADAGHSRYQRIKLTSYDNPLLNPSDIKELEDEIAGIGSANAALQEIMGEFVEVDAINPFAHQYDPEYHESEVAIHSPLKQLFISVDFNLNPFAVTFWHHWQDAQGYHYWGIDEGEIAQGSIPAMIDFIKQRYSNCLHTCVITGDALGKRGEIALRDNASHYQSLQRGLGLRESQIQVPGNPTHTNSRDDVNKLLYQSKQIGSILHFYLNPLTMPNTCRDFKNVQCDAFGSIIKGNRKDLNQRADFLDTGRSFINLVAKPILLRLGK